jgi:acetyl-CoA C-acetyltransferase
VYPLAGTESNHMVDLSARPALYRNIGVEVGAARALEIADVAAADLSEIELYSCFPAAVRIFARALGLDERGFDDRPLTVTGGMPFAGGPLNNFVVQGTARMVERLREAGQGVGLVTSVSGMITKAGFALYGTTPPAAGFGFDDVTDEVAARTDEREIVGDYAGRATVAGYTVVHLGDAPVKGLVVCDLADGRRTVASTEAPELCRAMTEVEICGREVRIEPAGSLARVFGVG